MMMETVKMNQQSFARKTRWTKKNRWRLDTPGHAGWQRTAHPNDPDRYLMISADCHANEPGNLWRERLDVKYRDRLPHVERDEKGEKWFVAEGLGRSRVRARMIADVPRENSEDRLRGNAGADPVERIKDHLRDGIDAEIIFPNKGLMMFATRDAAFGMAQCKVWNDFAWEMYGKYNDFMSPAAAIMTSDVALAIEEIRRVAKMGFRFLTLPCKPMFGGHDSRDTNYNLDVFDPMWEVIEEIDLPITFHVSTGRDPRAARKEGGAIINYVAHSLSPTIEPVASLCGSGVIERFPKVKFAAIESGIGWVPWALDAMDEAARKHHLWAYPKLKRLPSEYFRSNGAAIIPGGSARPDSRRGLQPGEQFHVGQRLSACRGNLAAFRGSHRARNGAFEGGIAREDPRPQRREILQVRCRLIATAPDRAGKLIALSR